MLRRIGFLDMIGHGTSDDDDDDGYGAAVAARPTPPPPSSAFSMSTEIQSLGREYEPGIAEELAREARAILPVLEQREPNRARAARAAVRIAKRRYGAR